VGIDIFEKLVLGLLVIPLISFSGEKASAFSITGAKINTAKVEYKIGKTQYYSQLNPSSIKSLPRGGTQEFLSLLEKQFRGWTFNTAAKDLTGNFDIDSYYACGTKTLCAKELNSCKCCHETTR
jgi:hypothetical protein